MFVLKSVKNIDKMAEDFHNNIEVEIGDSDIALQNDKHFLQFKIKNKPEVKKEKLIAKVGVYNLENSQMGPQLIPTDQVKQNLYGENKASKEIIKEFDNFFKRLHVYDELEILKKRGVLLYGPPGAGKSANISKAVGDLTSEKNTCVIFWSSTSVRSDDVLDLFATGIDYHKKVKRLVVIVEDIGMGVEGYSGAKQVDSALLNLLDGANATIKIPTFFVATTNYAHNLPEPLLRPGRFDNWIEVGYPEASERVELVEFLSKSKLSEEDKEVIKSKQLDKFSVAHLKELVIRTKRDEVSYKKVVDDLNKLAKKFGKGFEQDKGFGLL